MYADDLVIMLLSIEDLQNQIDNLISTVPIGVSRLINVKQRLW